MSHQVIEGTWEEIESHKAELTGRYLRVTIEPRKPTSRTSKTPGTKSLATGQMKQLTGFGAFRGKIGNSEEFAREKRMEIEREERHL